MSLNATDLMDRSMLSDLTEFDRIGQFGRDRGDLWVIFMGDAGGIQEKSYIFNWETAKGSSDSL